MTALFGPSAVVACAPVHGDLACVDWCQVTGAARKSLRSPDELAALQAIQAGLGHFEADGKLSSEAGAGSEEDHRGQWVRLREIS